MSEDAETETVRYEEAETGAVRFEDGHYPYNGWCYKQGCPVKAKDCPDCRKNEMALHIAEAFKKEFSFMGVGIEASNESWMAAGRGMFEKLGLTLKTRRDLVSGQVQYTIVMNISPLPDAGNDPPERI